MTSCPEEMGREFGRFKKKSRQLSSDHGVEKLSSDHGVEKLGADLDVESFLLRVEEVYQVINKPFIPEQQWKFTKLFA